jgi:putative salt-induced outer membrane protein YdiY
MKKYKYLVLSITLFFIATVPAYSDHIIRLHNNDILTGTLTKETADYIILESSVLGSLTIHRKHIAQIEPRVIHTLPAADEAQPVPDDAADWTADFETAYFLTRGNTETSGFDLKAAVKRKTDTDETTFLATVNQSSSEKKMNAQKWYAMGRYAYSFGEDLQWFNPFKFEIDHDKFANIDYRYIPSVGIGYWVSDQEPFKAMGEVSVGWEHTEYNDGRDASDEAILIPHAYAEYTTVHNLRISQDLIAFPALSDLGEYRFISTSAIAFPFTDAMSLKLSWVNEYNSDVSGDTEKLDQKLLTAFVYSFK